jgi:hypothetical protein
MEKKLAPSEGQRSHRRIYSAARSYARTHYNAQSTELRGEPEIACLAEADADVPCLYPARNAIVWQDARRIDRIETEYMTWVGSCVRQFTLRQITGSGRAAPSTA